MGIHFFKKNNRENGGHRENFLIFLYFLALLLIIKFSLFFCFPTIFSSSFSSFALRSIYGEQ